MLNKRNLIGILMLIMSSPLFFSCGQSGKELDTAQQEIYEVKLQSEKDYILASGEIATSDEKIIFSQYSGVVEQVFKNVGDSVEKGDKLFSYTTDNEEQEKNILQEELEKIKAENEYSHNVNVRNLENAKSQKDFDVSNAQHEIDNAEAEKESIYQKREAACDEAESILQQMSELPEDEKSELESIYQQLEMEIETLDKEYIIAENAVENAYSEYDNVIRENDKLIQQMQDIIDAEKFDNKLSECEMKINEIQEKLNNAVVISNSSGIITEVNVVPGDSIQEGAALKIADPESYIVTAHINEENIENIIVGMNVDISFVNSDYTFEGTVSKIYMVPDEAQDTYPIEINIDSSENKFIGRSVTVKIYSEDKENIMMIPYDYLKKDTDGSICVKKKTFDGEEEVNVKIGIKTADKVEIISDSIKEGDKLVKF